MGNEALSDNSQFTGLGCQCLVLRSVAVFHPLTHWKEVSEFTLCKG